CWRRWSVEAETRRGASGLLRHRVGHGDIGLDLDDLHPAQDFFEAHGSLFNLRGEGTTESATDSLWPVPRGVKDRSGYRETAAPRAVLPRRGMRRRLWRGT